MPHVLTSEHALALALQDTFIFRVESTGVLPPADIVITALDVLQNKLSTINGSLQTSKEAVDDPMQVG
jgi:RNA polymerase Rpb3/Rpb11 dimerisation domain